MRTINAKNYYEILKKQAERLLPEADYSCAIPVHTQRTEIGQLRKTIHYERFFFVMNNYNFNIEHVYGVEKWLGYNDYDFNYYKYVCIIHPTHLVAQLSNVYELLEIPWRAFIHWNL